MNQPEVERVYMELSEKISRDCLTKDFTELAVDMEVLYKALLVLVNTCTNVQVMLKDLLLSLQEQE